MLSGCALALIAAHAGCSQRERHFADLEEAILAESRRADSTPAKATAGASALRATSDAAALPAEGPIQLRDLLAVADERNPALAAARSAAGAAGGRFMQASAYPNPRVELASEEIPFRSGPGDAVTTLGLVQPIVLGERLEHAKTAAHAGWSAGRAEVEVQRRKVFADIAALHGRIIAIEAEATLYSDLLNLSDQMLETARRRFEARAAPEIEVIRTEIEARKLELARRRLAIERHASVQQLSLLLGGVDVDAQRLAGTVDDDAEALNIELLLLEIRRSHPALLAADHAISAAEAEYQRVLAERMPDLDVRAAVGYAGESDEAIFELGAGIMLPLWDQRRGAALAARFELMRARQERQAIESELHREALAMHGQFESLRSEIAALREEIVPFAERAFNQTQESYRAGRAVFLELLDAQRTLLEARITHTQLTGEAASIRAQLMQTVGVEASNDAAATIPGTQPATAGVPPIQTQPKEQTP